MSREVVVITGASAGVGRATARAFAKRGARIGLLARGSEGLNATKEDVEAAGGDALCLPTDVSDPEQIEAAAAEVEEAFSPIDIWINNAMVSVFSPVEDLTPEEYKRVTEVTYLGQVYGAMVALRRMKPRDHGSIIFVGSALAYRGIPLQSAYCGAKHGAQGFFDSLRSEMLHDESNVQLSMVHLPAMNTPQFDWSRNKMDRKPQPVPPIYQPEVAAEAICWAVDHDRRTVYVGWPTTQAIVGNKLFPGLADRYLAANGYEAQMQEEAAEEDSPENLWEPVEEDKGAHGAFGDRAWDWSLQWWASKNRTWLMALGIGVAAGLAGLLSRSED